MLHYSLVGYTNFSWCGEISVAHQRMVWSPGLHRLWGALQGQLDYHGSPVMRQCSALQSLLDWLFGSEGEDNWPWGVHGTHMRQAGTRLAGRLSGHYHINDSQSMSHEGPVWVAMTGRTKDAIQRCQRETQIQNALSYLHPRRHQLRELKEEEKNLKKRGVYAKETII